MVGTVGFFDPNLCTFSSQDNSESLLGPPDYDETYVANTAVSYYVSLFDQLTAQVVGYGHASAQLDASLH